LRVWVRCSSAREGSATPDGWLCTFCAPNRYVPIYATRAVAQGAVTL
jgi:hypothetical protein